MIDLGTLGGPFASAKGINDRSEIVGYSQTTAGTTQAFRWRRGRMTDLDRFGSEAFSSAVAINDRCQIVGESNGPVVWRGGRAVPLQLAPGAEFGGTRDNSQRRRLGDQRPGRHRRRQPVPGDPFNVGHAVLWH